MDDRGVASMWKLGFACAPVAPDDVGKKDYWMGGYGNPQPAIGVADPPMARVIYLSDGENSVFLAILDCVGFPRPYVCRLREAAAPFLTEIGDPVLNVLCTHNHAGLDTIGIWGPPGKSGADPDYICLIEAVILSLLRPAYESAKEGRLYYGSRRCPGLVRDIREPKFTDDTVTRLRFVPADGSRPFILAHFTAHPESLGSANRTVSRDYPGHTATVVEREADFAFAVGAIGGMQTTENLTAPDGTQLSESENCKRVGTLLGEAILAVKDDFELQPDLRQHSRTVEVPLTNPWFLAGYQMGILPGKLVELTGAPAVVTEVGYLRLGILTIALVPGELLLELVIGGRMPEHRLPQPEREDEPLLYDVMPRGLRMVFGLANDEIGYIVPARDFYLPDTFTAENTENPYDRFGRRHYEETSSLGWQTGGILLRAFEQLTKEIEE